MKKDGELSPLEKEVLGVLMNRRKARVREIFTVLRRSKKVALPSVAVMLDRLFERGRVSRKVEQARGGLRYVYFPVKKAKQREISKIDHVVNDLIQRFGSAAVSYFNERFGGKK